MEVTKYMKDITGQRFRRLIALEYVGNDKHQCAMWLCKCDCGNTKSILGASLRNGSTTSCGCYNAEKSSTHNLTNHRIFNIWIRMKDRCNNPKHMHYNRYGGRGIRIYEHWENDVQEFYNWAISHGYKPSLTIDRIDNDKGYYPENCRWATVKQQMRNKCTNINIYISGKRYTIPELSEIYGINVHTLYSRYRRGARGKDLIKKVKKGE